MDKYATTRRKRKEDTHARAEHGGRRYLADIDRQAQERMERLTEQMKRAQGITEQLWLQ